jgi:hypothetical protein
MKNNLPWQEAGREFSLAPFWLWNDDLTEAEIARQMDDFQAHGIHAFVIHPRVGLPRSIGWMSDRMLHFMRFAIEEAARRGMWVSLYDEGMYPSGSSSGQVVAENPAYQCRGIERIALAPGAEPELAEGQTLVAVVARNGQRFAFVDRPIFSVIRGLHFFEDDPPRHPDHVEVAEETPPAADILNPDAVRCFIRLVYERFYEAFGDHFGETVRTIFTDEPSLLGRPLERGIMPGTTGILQHINAFLGYDFAPLLPALWDETDPDHARAYRDFSRAVQARLEETFYKPIYEWCSAHGIDLIGHPAEPDAIGQLRYFHAPGQDIVWRYIEPDTPSALEGAQSTQAKCASSAMLHLGRRRNMNEYCGAYGHGFTFAEMRWLSNWLFVRGCNLLIPHAFYYSVRGPRIDERPPDVGPNSAWWEDFGPYADACRRLCWLNTDAEHVCDLAILGRNDWLPWKSAAVCYRHQYDFNYLEARHLWEDAEIDPEGIHLAGMTYRALIVEGAAPPEAMPALEALESSGRLIRWSGDEAALIDALSRLIAPTLRVEPAAPALRVRHMIKTGRGAYILFNEEVADITIALPVGGEVVEPVSGRAQQIAAGETLTIPGHTLHVLWEK